MPTRILIADDNSLVRAALRQVLENSEDCEIVEAENGEEAILKALECRPHLIILDLAMPLMDGFRTARELSRVLPTTPVLMHTLYWSPRIQIEAMKLGVRKTVPKSESSVLISAVREILASPSAPPAEALPQLLDATQPPVVDLPVGPLAISSIEAKGSAQSDETTAAASDEPPSTDTLKAS